MSRAIFKSTTIVGVTTLLSRITGLLRDMVYSQSFGAGTLMDAFLVAFKIPNFLRRLFAEGAFSQSFVPVISEFKVRRTRAEVRDLVAGVFGTLGGLLTVVTAIGVLAAPLIIVAVRARLHAAAGQVRAGGLDAALDLPVPVLHLADGVAERRAQQLRSLRDSGLHAGADEPGDDPVRAAVRDPQRQSG